MSRRVVLRDHMEKLADRGIEIEAPNGEVFKIPPPQLWSDEVYASSGQGPVAEATAIMGAEQYAAFVAAGGSARVLTSIIEEGFEATIPE